MAFADVVEELIAHYGTIVAPVPVSSRVPTPRPETFVQVRRTGGVPPGTIRDRVRLDVIAWAPTEPEATALVDQLRTATWALSGKVLGDTVVYDVGTFAGPTQTDDDVTGSPITFWRPELIVRAEDVIQPASS